MDTWVVQQFPLALILSIPVSCECYLTEARTRALWKTLMLKAGSNLEKK